LLYFSRCLDKSRQTLQLMFSGPDSRRFVQLGLDGCL
jgi:hypothetical protein